MNTDKINLALEISEKLNNMKDIIAMIQKQLSDLHLSMTLEEQKAFADALWLKGEELP